MKKGPNDGIEDLMHLKKPDTTVDKKKPKTELQKLESEVRKLNADLISREKIHFQKQYDFLNKAQDLDDELAKVNA